MSRSQLNIFFAAHDSLFFRGSRPHSAAGGSSLSSEFPPAVSTLSGSLRTRLGDALGVCWKSFRKGRQQVQLGNETLDLEELIGSGDQTGLLQFGELKLYKNGKRLFPMPAILLQDNNTNLVKMELGDPVRCDLGNVRLGQLPKGVINAKPLENAWLTQAGFETFIKGGLPSSKEVVTEADLFVLESRLGIGRNNSKARVEAGLLYQTKHLRLQPDVEFAVEVSLPSAAAKVLSASITASPMQRFGGEGRMASLRVKEAGAELPKVKGKPSLLMLLTDMLPHDNFAKQPLAQLQPAVVDGVDCWEGELEGVGLRLWNVASGKARRLGGWDARLNQPRPVQSFLPAGSCFFVEPLNTNSDLTQLHTKTLGRRTDFGFGTLVCVL